MSMVATASLVHWAHELLRKQPDSCGAHTIDVARRRLPPGRSPPGSDRTRDRPPPSPPHPRRRQSNGEIPAAAISATTSPCHRRRTPRPARSRHDPPLAQVDVQVIQRLGPQHGLARAVAGPGIGRALAGGKAAQHAKMPAANPPQTIKPLHRTVDIVGIAGPGNVTLTSLQPRPHGPGQLARAEPHPGLLGAAERLSIRPPKRARHVAHSRHLSLNR
ncbi:hypothetical protein MTBLM5_20048 [Magnetospirillum sp. LM-5]|nr:hypothetical protein MTBLM5_20048 [Magnetospirillum sp. LM-5]